MWLLANFIYKYINSDVIYRIDVSGCINLSPSVIQNESEAIDNLFSTIT
jgi:hypothetical protein